MNQQFKEKYHNDGYLIINNAIDSNKINLFKSRYLDCSADTNNKANIFQNFYNYSEFPELMDLLCDEKIYSLFQTLDMEVALHASSATVVSSDINWHQDCRVASKIAGDSYIGVWIALEDISIESGPFQLIPGSHKWSVPFEELYPKEKFTHSDKPYEYFTNKINDNNYKIVSFVPKAGDILFWHGHLVHRGSHPIDSSLTRMAAIGHYCNLRVDGPPESPALDSKAHGLGEIFDTWNGAKYFKTSLGKEY